MATSQEQLTRERSRRARAIARAGSIEKALAAGGLSRVIDITLSEALVLGLLRQGVRKYLCVLGHGSTEVGEVLRVYQEAGLVRACGVRSEIEASHAATALRWVTGEKAAVVTSIGPGALQALAASIAPASDGLGVWYLLGDPPPPPPRRPRTKDRICSRSRVTSRTPFCGSSAPPVGLIRCTLRGDCRRRSGGDRMRSTIRIRGDRSFC